MTQREPDELCPGEGCPLKMTCQNFYRWMWAHELEGSEELTPDYHDGKCENYDMCEYYGN